ncbi:hypothetical protein [Bacillus niameyensis]|uniref:hypothetical protein n=1 Tax=Bacillus niameyensis TaxID=1522308 RepID=UPI000782BF62|nr:hypothetical protein [Bacillus niameyensis]
MMGWKDIVLKQVLQSNPKNREERDFPEVKLINWKVFLVLCFMMINKIFNRNRLSDLKMRLNESFNVIVEKYILQVSR